MNQRTPRNQSLELPPQQRRNKLTAELGEIIELRGLKDTPGYKILDNKAKAEVKRRRNAQNAINFDSKPEVFMAHEKRSTFVAGYIQGAEFVINLMANLDVIEQNLRKEIDQIDKDIKHKRTTR